MGFWFKIIFDTKLIKDCVIKCSGNLTDENYLSVLRIACQKLDIPTPMTLPCHFRNLRAFNGIRYRADDFIEIVDFDRLELEVY